MNASSDKSKIIFNMHLTSEEYMARGHESENVSSAKSKIFFNMHMNHHLLQFSAQHLKSKRLDDTFVS